ncbi:hypothetical protein EVAR_98073_1 [Eumeta japonica]|uniref:Uncharacterized protein n=1 Tax=Eumeta variegata TaxID=151549 RepID=A0A4C1WEQ1_EUMVA|nr:hypothetical protein EVAR_98073_1 [Eumeta japonica]
MRIRQESLTGAAGLVRDSPPVPEVCLSVRRPRLSLLYCRLYAGARSGPVARGRGRRGATGSSHATGGTTTDIASSEDLSRPCHIRKSD